MAWKRAILPVVEGGMGAPSMKIWYEAIKIGWLKRWWHPEPDRPDWAWVSNEIMLQSAQHKPDKVRLSTKEWICQSWPIKTQSSYLPDSLKEAIIVTQKYNVSISVMRAPTNLQLEMLAFHHPFAKNKYLQADSRAMRCLQLNHKIKLIGDLVKTASEVRLNPPIACMNNKSR
jgi:hypothetical protein